VALAALAGCDETNFQSPPARVMQSCDPHFVGSWLVTDTGTSPSCDDHELCELLIVDENCSSWHLAEGNGEASDEDRRKEQETHIAFADLRGRKLVTMSADLEDSDPMRVHYHWQQHYAYFRYEIAGDTIRLYMVDSKRVAQLIESKAVAGETKIKDAHKPRQGHVSVSTLTNYVVGDARAMERVVLLPGVFQDSPVVLLKRIDPADIVKPAPTAPAP
jgi:hypothetical protein